MLIHDFFVYIQRGACALFPGEAGGALQAQAFHAPPQFGIQQNVLERAGDFAAFVGIEE